MNSGVRDQFAYRLLFDRSDLRSKDDFLEESFRIDRKHESVFADLILDQRQIFNILCDVPVRSYPAARPYVASTELIVMDAYIADSER